MYNKLVTKKYKVVRFKGTESEGLEAGGAENQMSHNRYRVSLLQKEMSSGNVWHNEVDTC